MIDKHREPKLKVHNLNIHLDFKKSMFYDFFLTAFLIELSSYSWPQENDKKSIEINDC